MKTRKRTQFILLLITLGLLVSMIISFTPSFGALFGNQNNVQDDPAALLVNGQKITESQVAIARRNPPFQSNFEGEVGKDLDTLLVDNLIQTELIRQASAKEKVSSAEVKQAVNDWRDSNGVGGRNNDGEYINLISRFGYDDASFRNVFREQLRMDKYRNNLTDNVEVSDDEIKSYYDVNKNRYQTTERILAREIVLDDKDKADKILQELKDGADFAELASKNSIEKADRAGALGAAKDTTEPKAVGRAALPTAVADAAFALQGSGTTGLVEANDKFYIVKVEEYLPSGPQPLEEVREQVKNDALDAKKAGVFEQTMTSLRSTADIEIPASSTISYDNEAVAKVNDTEITRAELARAVYNNPQIAQALRPDTTQIITSLFKPSILESLVDRELAYQGAQKLDAKFFGSKDNIALSALGYVSKDATVNDDEIKEYYDSNIARYTIPAKAVVNRINFDSREAANSFREKMIAGEDLTASMEELAGTLVDLGTVNPGSLPSEIDKVLFGTDAFTALPDSNEEISDVLVLTEDVPLEDGLNEQITTDEEAAANDNADTSTDSATTDAAATDTSTSDTTATDAATTDTTDAATSEPKTKEVDVVLIAERTPEVIRPLDEVKSQVKAAVLAQKQQDLQKAWLDDLRSSSDVETFVKSEDLVTDPITTTTTDTVTTEDGAFETTPLPEDNAPTNDSTSHDNTMGN